MNNNRLPNHCPNQPVSIVPGQQNHPRSYNLNIHAYSFDEILGIFGLTYDITLEDMKRAKKQVMMTHPDKSHLPNEYFQFYRQAYGMVLRHFETTNTDIQKNEDMNRYKSSTNEIKYTIDQTFVPGLQRAAKNLDMSQFNRLFDENVATRPDPSKNKWFADETQTNAFAHTGKVSAGNIGSAMNNIRTNAAQQGVLTKYTGVKEIKYATGTNFHDEDDEDEDADDVYVVCDPFSKLKFDDLRKVHRDQTIFNVSENDFNESQSSTFKTYMSERNNQNITPLQKQEAESLLRQKEAEYRERMAKKQHADELRMLNMQERVKNVEAYYLQLENGTKNRR